MEDKMSDKEVGELWRDAATMNGSHYWAGQCQALIRKLVAEATSGEHARCPFDYHDEIHCSESLHRERVLVRFGIAPEEWK